MMGKILLVEVVQNKSETLRDRTKVVLIQSSALFLVAKNTLRVGSPKRIMLANSLTTNLAIDPLMDNCKKLK